MNKTTTNVEFANNKGGSGNGNQVNGSGEQGNLKEVISNSRLLNKSKSKPPVSMPPIDKQQNFEPE